MSPMRLGLLLLTTVLCLGVFMLSLLDNMTLADLGRTASANEYASNLVKSWHGKPFEEIRQLAQSEIDRLVDVQVWYYGSDFYEPPFETEDEAVMSIADLPDLVDAVRRRNNNDFADTLDVYWEALWAIRDEANYLAGYSDYLTSIQSQANIQSQTSLFGKPGSFSRRNLAKTAEDFEHILGVQVEFGNSRGIEWWLDFKLGDYFHLIVIVLIVMSFLEERRRGLWPVISATRGGRGRLGLTRIGILFAGSVLATALYTALPFAVSMSLHGGWSDLTRPLQSVESFSTCPLRISVLEWLVQFFAVKILSGVLIGLLLWCVLGSITNPQFSITVLGVTLAAEFALYEYLPVQSILNGLKYFNIFAYVHTSTLYTEYLNVDLFGFPVGIRVIALWGLVIFGVLFVLWAIFTQIKRRPEGNRDILSRISAPINRVLDVIRSRLSVGGWEGYKSLIFQYGILLLVLVYLIGGELTFLDADSDPVDPWYDAYISDMEGPINDSTNAYLARARENAGKSEDAAALLSALDRVEARVEILRQRSKEGDYEPWVAREFTYDIGYGPQSQNKQRLNAAIAILLTTIMASSLWAFERQSGVTPMLRSTPRGRGRLFRRKAITAALLAAFVWACVYIREVRFFLYQYPIPTTLSAPVGNFDSLAQFPLNITIWQYMLLVYVVRLLMLIGVAETALAIGLFCPNVRTAYMAGTALLGIPALLTALGAEMFKWISPLVPVASAELMWGLGSGSLIYALPWGLWLFCGVSALWLCRRRWVT